MAEQEKHQDLQRGLKNRHIQMIALGGAIGTGLFYGSAATIKLVGPAVILSYLIGGGIIYLVMRMLGEMSTEEPVAGAFSHFAYKYWGAFPGFLSGWNYWFLYVLVSMAELSVIGIYVDYWIPGFPHWISSLLVLVTITGINLANVRLYGEFEFWFALIKVVAVIGMILLGVVLIFVGMGKTGSAIGFSNLWAHGGFLPEGFRGLFLSLAVVMFSFGGTELIGITAGEAADPKKSIPRAIKQVMWRILIFYVGALTVMMIIYPWNKIGMEGSPFVMIFSNLGIPAAATILNIVVLSAAISVYNSGIYSNGRMLYGLAEQGNAPKIFARLSKNKVPVLATLFSSLCTLGAVILSYLIPGGAFMQVMSLATAAAAITWAMIVLVQLRFRKAHADTELTFKAPFYPYSNYLCLSFLAMVIAMMTQLDNMKNAVYLIPIWLTIIYIGFTIKKSLANKQGIE